MLSKQELQEHGVFAAILSKNFEIPVFGGWTLELTFTKPVFEYVFWAGLVWFDCIGLVSLALHT